MEIVKSFDEGYLKHAYVRKLYRLMRKGKLPNITPGVHLLNIQHDDWCPINNGLYCTCDADVIYNGKLVK